MKEALEVCELREREASPALDTKREAKVAEAAQQKERLQDRRFADIIGAEEKVEAAEAVEREVGQAPEAADLNAIKMLLRRHAQRTRHAGSDTPIRRRRTG